MAYATLAGQALASPPAPPQITGRAGLVMDVQSGEVLWESHADLPLPPASTTKILTAVLALESGRLEQKLVVSPNAQAQAPSKLDLRAGQQVRLIDLVYALLLKSANDAAAVVAEGLDGSIDQFAMRMNVRARQLGATRSHFRNPHGLPDDDHVSTAHDLAMILRHALGVPGFRGIASTRETEIPVIDATVRMLPVRSHNRLLDSYVVPVIGKTGYTRAARRCFAGAAELGGREVIVVVLGSTNLWGDARRLVEYGLRVVAPDAAAKVRFAAVEKPPRTRASARSSRTPAAKAKRKPAKTDKTAASSRPATEAREARTTPVKARGKPGASARAGEARETPTRPASSSSSARRGPPRGGGS